MKKGKVPTKSQRYSPLVMEVPYRELALRKQSQCQSRQRANVQIAAVTVVGAGRNRVKRCCSHRLRD